MLEAENQVPDLPEGYKTTELGPLPEEWEVVRLEDLAIKTFGGGTPSTKKTEFWDGPIPWTTTAVIRAEDTYLQRFQRGITEKGLQHSSTRVVPKGSILVGTRVGVGKAVVTTFDVAINQDITTIVPSEDVSSEFLVLSLKTPGLQRWFAENKRGTTIKGVPRNDVLDLRLPFPPLPEQRAIARMLRTVQQAKEATEKVIVAARELKKSLMRHLFTYGPVPVEEAESVPLKETQFRLVPEKWRIMSLSECASVQTGVTKGRKLGGSHIIEVPYLRVANVQDGYLDLEKIKRIRIRESEIERYRLRIGDVLLTEGGDFDKLGRGFVWQEQIPNCVHQNHIFAVRADKRDLMPEYLAYLAQSQYGKAYFLNVAHRTTNLASINSTKLKAFPVLIPPLPEQREIARILSAVDSKIAAEENRKRTLEALFKTLLHHLMTGKLRVEVEAGGR